MAVQFVSLAPFSLDSSPILENMHRYHTYKMHTSSCQETLRKTMEEALWEVGASKCLQVAGAGSNGLIFSQIDLLAKPPPHPILNKTSQRKKGWGDLRFGSLDNPYINMDYPPPQFWNWGGRRWKKKVGEWGVIISIQILIYAIYPMHRAGWKLGMSKRGCEVKESLKLGDSGTPLLFFRDSASQELIFAQLTQRWG